MQAIFEKEEVDSMKKFDEPGLLLLGFKPKSRLKEHHYVKPANFIYPDESVSGVVHPSTLPSSTPSIRQLIHPYIHQSIAHAHPSVPIHPTPLLQVITGSTKLFTALLTRCLARDVVAICRYIPRANSPPSFIALVPQVRKQTTPTFHSNCSSTVFM